MLGRFDATGKMLKLALGQMQREESLAVTQASNANRLRPLSDKLNQPRP
jgi:hypothetical protein